MPSQFSHRPARRAGVRSLLLSLVLLATCGLATAGRATTRAWNNPAGGAWSNATNWSPGGVPGAGDVAQLGALSGPYTVTLDVEPLADELDVAAGAQLDATSHNFASVLQLHNTGTIANFRGIYDGARVHNDAGGVIQVAAADSAIVAGPVTNNGRIEVGPGVSSALYLAGLTTFSGTGSVVLTGHGRVNSALPRPETSIWLVNAAGHTLAGAGDVWAPIENHGTILEDATYGRLLVLREYLYNYGTVRVSDSATVQVDCPLVKQFGGRIVGQNGNFLVMLPYEVGGTIDNLHGGSFVADGGDLGISAGVIANGSIERTGGSGAVAILSVATPSYIVVQPDAELRVDGLMDVTVDSCSIMNHGTVRVRGTLNMHPVTGRAQFLYGDGALVLENGTLGASDAGGGVLVNAPGHTIRGCGTIVGNLDNEGTLDIDCGSYFPETLKGGTLTNRTRIHVSRGILTLAGGEQLVNKGTLDGDGGQVKIQDNARVDNTGGTLRAGSNHVFLGDRKTVATLVGGTLATNGVGLFQNLGQATLTDVTLDGAATFKTWNGATTHATGAAFRNKGLNQVEAGGAFTLDPATDYTAMGGATLLDGGMLTVPRGYTVDGLLAGTGTVIGNVTNAGLVQPGVGANALTVQGNYAQTAAGHVAFGIGGAATGQYARLLVSGTAALAGQAIATALNGYVAPSGAAIPVMGFASYTGAFSDLASDAALTLKPTYASTGILLQSSSTVGVGDLLPTVLAFAPRGDRFRLDLPEAAHVSIVVYTVDGRALGTLFDGVRAAGSGTIDWSGLRSAPARGIYFARATVRFAGRTETRTARALVLR